MDLPDGTSEAIALQCEAAPHYVFYQQRQLLKYYAFLALDIAGISIAGYQVHNFNNLESKLVFGAIALFGGLVTLGTILNISRTRQTIANIRNNLKQIANQ